MKLVPDPPSVVTSLQTAPVLEDARAFLELAHKQVDAVQAITAYLFKNKKFA